MKKRTLKKGINILFFGSPYVINKVIDFDKIEVTEKNGFKKILWFPNLPGREIIK